MIRCQRGGVAEGTSIAYPGIMNVAYLKELEGGVHKLENLDLTNIEIASRKKDAGENSKQAVERTRAFGEETN